MEPECGTHVYPVQGSQGLALETGKPPPSRPVVSAGSGQNDHLSEIISHVLEPLVKMRPGGMEVTSTGDFISRVEETNRKNIAIEDIDLNQVDHHLDEMEKEAQRRYDDFNQNQLKNDDTLAEGWKVEDLRDEVGEPSTWLDELTRRWKNTEFNIILDRLGVVNNWPTECKDIKESFTSWLLENDEATLEEEGEDILDGLEVLREGKEEGVSDEVLMDVTDIITSILIGSSWKVKQVAPIFQQAGEQTRERIKRVGRAEGMKKMRDEIRKLSNARLKHNIKKHEFQDMEVGLKRRGDCSKRRESGEVRSEHVENKYVQDSGSRLQIVGSDVEALYPSLEAIQVAEIVYQAVLEYKVKFKNVDWMTSTQQECMMGPLGRV